MAGHWYVKGVSHDIISRWQFGCAPIGVPESDVCSMHVGVAQHFIHDDSAQQLVDGCLAPAGTRQHDCCHRQV